MRRSRRIDWLPEAEHNRASQLTYIAERNPAAAIRVGGAIVAAVRRLAAFPESARPGRVPGTRELVVPRTPYIVVYRVETVAVVILRVLHSAQQWPPH